MTPLSLLAAEAVEISESTREWYRFAADATMAAHWAIVAFVVIGLPVILIGGLLKWKWVRNPWFRLIHFATILIVVVEAAVGYECPFTTWERQFKIAAGDPYYEGGFIANNMRGCLFPENWPEWVFTPVYYTFGGLVLVTLLLVPIRFRRGDHGATETVETSESKLSTQPTPTGDDSPADPVTLD